MISGVNKGLSQSGKLS